METIKNTQASNLIDFGSKLKAIRNKHSLTRAEFSKRSNIPEMTIRSWERNHRRPSYINQLKIIELFSSLGSEIEASWFYGDVISSTENYIQINTDNIFCTRHFVYDNKYIKIAHKRLTKSSDITSNISLLDYFSELSNEYRRVILESDNHLIKLRV